MPRMSVAALVPEQVYTKLFREPGEVNQLELVSLTAQQASWHQSYKVTIRDNFRDEQERGGRQNDSAFVAKRR